MTVQPDSTPTAETFDEAAYLLVNPDVAAEVRNGGLTSGRQHFELYGRAEGRVQAPPGTTILPHTLVRSDRMPSFADLTDDYPDHLVPPLDRETIDETKLTWNQIHWRRFGFLPLPGLIPQATTQAYLDFRDRQNIGLGGLENTVHGGTAPEILDIGCFPALADAIREIFGEDLFFNFSLSQFTSTERDWHQDDYLGSPTIYARYCAAWVAVDDVHPDSGVFELIPGSHRWPGLRGHKVKDFLAPEAREWLGRPGEAAHWGTLSESYTTPALEAEIARRGLPSQFFQARRGDVLLWHGRLVHRGTRPATPGMRRPALITHYYPADEAPGREFARHKGGGIYPQ